MPTVHLEIPNPCSEKWSAMSPSGSDCRHCATCAKNILDFTFKTDAQILAILQQNNGQLCGRFRQDQLSRPLVATRVRRRFGLATIAAGFTTLLAAQQPMEGAKAPEILLQTEQVAAEPLPEPSNENPVPANSQPVIPGKVTEEDSPQGPVGVTVTKIDPDSIHYFTGVLSATYAGKYQEGTAKKSFQHRLHHFFHPYQ